MQFICSICGNSHDTSEISFGTEAPLQWDLLSDAERSGSLLSPDQCEIVSSEGKSYYIRACLQIPIRDKDQSFTWGVWCSLSEKSYSEISENWENPDRTQIGPHFGWLCTDIPSYPQTAFLKTMVHQRSIGMRPLVKLEPTDHPLAIDQKQGIDERRLAEVIAKLLHKM